MNIVGKRVIMRAIERTDLPALMSWANDPQIQYALGGWHFPSSSSVMDRWFESIQKDELNQRFAVTLDGLLVGTANLVSINWKDRNAFHGMLLGDPAIRGRGVGQDVVMTVMRYAFRELGLNRLDGSIIEDNEPSRKLYVVKCGWKVEGTMRKWYYRKGRYWDKLIVGVTAEEYFALEAATHYWD